MPPAWVLRAVNRRMKEDWLPTLVNELPLTPFDRTAPTIYTRLVYGFPFNDINNIPACIDYLKINLLRAFSRWPYLAGQVIHPSPNDPDHPMTRVVYTDNQEDWNITRFPREVFDWQIVKEGGDQYPWTFERLEE